LAVAAAITAATLAFNGTPAFADTDTPDAPSATQAPVTSSAPETTVTDEREPLPAAVYSDTPKKTAALSQMAADACATLLPDNPDPQKMPWHLTRLNMEQAWQIATGKGIKIAVIDTGISVDGSGHTPTSRFSAYDVLPTRDGAAADEKFDCQHGTIVASLIGAQRSGSVTEFSGIAPDAQIIGIRALYGQDPQEIDGVVAAIWAAIDMDVRIINISQAAVENRGEYAEAIQAALDKGIVVVAAAGNTNAMPTDGFAFPAAYPGVISVGMTNAADVADPNSYAMPGYVTVAAPGVDLLALGPSSASGGQVYLNVDNGTSYATPIVTGVVALMLEQADRQGVHLTPAEVAERLTATADPPAGPVPDPQLGYGIVNPVRALMGVAPPATDTVSAAPTPSQSSRPPSTPADPRPLRFALVIAALAIALVLLGLAIHVALPAARARGGRPADPSGGKT